MISLHVKVVRHVSAKQVGDHDLADLVDALPDLGLLTAHRCGDAIRQLGISEGMGIGCILQRRAVVYLLGTCRADDQRGLSDLNDAVTEHDIVVTRHVLAVLVHDRNARNDRNAHTGIGLLTANLYVLQGVSLFERALRNDDVFGRCHVRQTRVVAHDLNGCQHQRVVGGA